MKSKILGAALGTALLANVASANGNQGANTYGFSQDTWAQFIEYRQRIIDTCKEYSQISNLNSEEGQCIALTVERTSEILATIPEYCDTEEAREVYSADKECMNDSVRQLLEFELLTFVGDSNSPAPIIPDDFKKHKLKVKDEGIDL